MHWSLAHGIPRVALDLAARRGDLQGRLVAATRSGDPDEAMAVVEEVRRAGPLHRARLAYLTADHAVVRDVLGSNAFASGLGDPGESRLARLTERTSATTIHPVRPPSLLVIEPPDHTRLRRLVSRVFTARAVEALRERVEQIAASLLDGLDGLDPSAPVDLVEHYCNLLPVTVISEVLGVPLSERERVLALGRASSPSLDLGLSWRLYRESEDALASFDAWLTDHLDRLRAAPGDDLLSRLVTLRDEEGALSELELKATAGLVLAAGFETTVNLLGNGVALLASHPEARERLVADPSLWGNAVEEVLRVDPPVFLTARTCAEPTTVAGTPVRPGAIVTTVLAGANRDPAVFADPDRFDVVRENARDHLSFSAGRHFCLGAALARMEGEVGLRALFERHPDLRLEPGARRRRTRILRGYETLPVTLRP